MKDKDEQVFHISAASGDRDYTITETKNYKAGGVAQLVECFLNMHKALGSIPGIVKEHGGTHYALVIQAVGKAEARGSGVQGQPPPHSEILTSRPT